MILLLLILESTGCSAIRDFKGAISFAIRVAQCFRDYNGAISFRSTQIRIFSAEDPDPLLRTLPCGSPPPTSSPVATFSPLRHLLLALLPSLQRNRHLPAQIFLEEQIVNHEGDVEPTVSVFNGFVAFTRYCRFLLLDFKEYEAELEIGNNRIGERGQKKELGHEG